MYFSFAFVEEGTDCITNFCFIRTIAIVHFTKRSNAFFFLNFLLLLSNRPTGLIRSSSRNVRPFVSLPPSHPSSWCPFLFYICCWKFLLVIYVIYFLFNVSDGFKFSYLLTRLRVSFCAQCYRLWLDFFSFTCCFL